MLSATHLIGCQAWWAPVWYQNGCSQSAHNYVRVGSYLVEELVTWTSRGSPHKCMHSQCKAEHLIRPPTCIIVARGQIDPWQGADGPPIKFAGVNISLASTYPNSTASHWPGRAAHLPCQDPCLQLANTVVNGKPLHTFAQLQAALALSIVPIQWPGLASHCTIPDQHLVPCYRLATLLFTVADTCLANTPLLLQDLPFRI